MNIRSFLALAATICFGVVFVDHGLVGEFDMNDLVTLGFALFSASHV